MNRYRLRKPFRIHIHALDLIDHGDPILLKDPIGTSFYEKLDLLFFIRSHIPERNLGFVPGSHLFLELSVYSAPG